MNIAPLQPDSIVFEDVSVQVRLNEQNTCTMAPGFNFQGVNFSCEVGHGNIEKNEGGDGPYAMLVSVRLQIDNASGNPAPYNVHVKVSGIFNWLEKSTEEIARKDLIVVNGASILYGAIREMVLSITSRSIAGALTLPSFNFLDNKPSETAITSTEGVAMVPKKTSPRKVRAVTKNKEKEEN